MTVMRRGGRRVQSDEALHWSEVSLMRRGDERRARKWDRGPSETAKLLHSVAGSGTGRFALILAAIRCAGMAVWPKGSGRREGYRREATVPRFGAVRGVYLPATSATMSLPFRVRAMRW